MICKRLKEYSRGFDQEDAGENSASKKLVAQPEGKRLVDEWHAWCAHVRGQREEEGIIIPSAAPKVETKKKCRSRLRSLSRRLRCWIRNHILVYLWSYTAVLILLSDVWLAVRVSNIKRHCNDSLCFNH